MLINWDGFYAASPTTEVPAPTMELFHNIHRYVHWLVYPDRHRRHRRAKAWLYKNGLGIYAEMALRSHKT